MKWLSGVSILIAVALAVGYLVARPHFETVYVAYLALPHLVRDPQSKTVYNKPQEIIVDEFATEAECDTRIAALTAGARQLRPTSSAPVRRSYCRPAVRLRWGR